MIVLKSHEEIERMKIPNRIAVKVLHKIKEHARPGISTKELDELTESMLKKLGGTPAFKGYRGFPASLCASVNEVIVHGIPSKRKLVDGDILSLDFGVYIDGFYGDAAITIPIGNISSDAEKLLETTREALYKSIEKAREGNRLFDISASIESEAGRNGYSVVREFVGHGIGRDLHEDPQVPNYGTPGTGIKLKAGMVLAIEPMINAGGSDVRIKKDGWTAVTRDGSLSAHFEQSVAITSDGPVILSEA